MEIGKYIKELLFIHDCVIIPGLGGFVANYRPAEVNELSKSISPPSKSILFNRNLVHNDGLLIGYVSQKTGSDYNKSEELVKEYAERINKSISDGEKFPADEIGFFYADSQRRLQFQDETTTNFLLASYGLTTVHFEPVEKEQVAIIPEVVYRSEGTGDRVPVMNLRRWIYTGVAASLVAAMVLIPVKTGYVEHMNFGWLNRESHQQVIQHDQTSDPVSADTETTIELTPLNYHIIVGSFKDFSNARKLNTRLSEQGHGSKIMEASNGYYRVAIHTAEDAGMASDELSKIRQMEGFEKAWILKE
jgi:hypothetical protein